MSVKRTTKKNDLPEITRELELIDKMAVEVGALQGDHRWLAHIHEFGCDIEVTPKIRAYLHSQGLHLKESTTEIKIPERSFLRTGYDNNRDKVMKKASKLLADVAAGTMTANEMVKAVGLELSSKIKDYATDLQSPPNHPFTTERKGSSNPLVGSGDMIGGITWRAKK